MNSINKEITVKEKMKNSLSLILSMVEQGKTDKEIAKKLSIGYSTLRKYKKEDSEVKAVYAQGKDNMNQAVIKSLYMLTQGYDYYEEVISKKKEEVLADDGKTILKKETPIAISLKKRRGKDLNAVKYWLENKDKKNWKADPSKVAMHSKDLNLKKKEIESKTIEM